MNTLQQFDVIIIGGGIAGSSPNAKTLKVGESLPGEAKNILQSLGVFEGINNDAMQGKHNFCYENCSTWGSDDLLGSNTIFEIYETLLKTANLQHGQFITIMRDSKVTGLFISKDINHRDTHWKIKISNIVIQINGKILIDASGRQCCIRKCLSNLKRNSFDKLLAFACLFEADNDISCKVDSNHYTLIESCAFGWWYISLLPNKQRIVVFHTDDDLHQINRNIRLVEEFNEFIKETTVNFTRNISEHSYRPVGKRVMCMPANSTSLSQFGMLTALYSAKLGAEAIFFQYFNGKEITNKDNRIQPLEVYQQYLENTFNKYMREKEFFYNKEQRWNNEMFWKRRHKNQSYLNIADDK
ncbi:3190_t:CDS:2 [Diversispora eburnea]|uniref:3190_t:CDS:1 n=1 Tax=Diversispora eburnea TaxID=1213867 RepID=A0A9N9BMX9_9GLOM|nr:3190_t:CDS:2 [Diversispora eburnea]